MNIDTKGLELGDVVRDTITGYQGTIVAVSQFTTGCARAMVQTKVTKDGTVPEPVSSDVLTLELVKAGPRHAVERDTGGPQLRVSARVADVRR